MPSPEGHTPPATIEGLLQRITQPAVSYTSEGQPHPVALANTRRQIAMYYETYVSTGMSSQEALSMLSEVTGLTSSHE